MFSSSGARISKKNDPKFSKRVDTNTQWFHHIPEERTFHPIQCEKLIPNVCISFSYIWYI
jgi:hypothetical protein